MDEDGDAYAFRHALVQEALYDDLLVVDVCVAGLEAEAAAAELARARRSGPLDAARQVAAELVGRARAAGRGPHEGRAAAESLTAEAEWSRIEGGGDPARWAAAAAAWDALAFPFPAAYARFRQAEALQAAVAHRLGLAGPRPTSVP